MGNLGEVWKVEKDDRNFPPLLRELEIGYLYGLGDREILTEKMMLVVGSRKMSRRGEMMTKMVVKEVVGKGYVVLSGLARGIDSVAHQECLRCGGKTMAVLGHGLDMVYPPENEGLFKEIIEGGGVVLSPFEVGVKPEPKHFPWRNRIMVGMSVGVVVVEAGMRSGTLTTANWAAEIGRELLVVPGSVGGDYLIKEGAKVWEV
jgi:DNA processing protein